MSSRQNTSNLTCTIIPFQVGDAYQEMLLLRTNVLRNGLLPYTIEQLESEKNDVHIGLYLIESAVMIGCCLIRKIGQWSQMRQVAIDPSVQGKGYGSTLISYFENQSRSQGLFQLFIEARESAIPFYIKHGYQVSSTTFINAESSLINVRLEKILTNPIIK